MSTSRQLMACAVTMVVLGGCAGTAPRGADSVACLAPLEASPPSATTPTGPTAMNPPPGYPAMMNPTAPTTVAAEGSNLGHGGARTPPPEANLARDYCERLASERLVSRS